MTTPAVVPLTDPALLRSLHRDVLVPSFPPAELVDEQELLDAHASGRLRSLGVVEEGRVVAGVVGEWFADARVLLVLYLAIARGRRGGGVGRRLVTTALDDWRALDPLVVVGEVEHPAHHTGSEAHGDPVARLRFYARLGARVLALPYFQPGDGPGGERVPALLLVSFPLGPHAAEDDVPAAPLRAFLAENLRESEGTVADDAATRRLLDAAGGDSVRLVDPDDPAALATVPVGTLSPAETRAPTA
ncbi:MULTISPECIES: GNAT family N-acetyltransferase [Cellulosimicrobium]|uniref:GNAT family N-acetyltransferase n=1 Tax=Cellulosimicrobium funkei TaxID=264251 RepID=A0A4Y8R1K0_9MICO|nr:MULTISPECIES: GNAT family N-acetyltransferase [Cellulosimicrobium]TFF10390.1 GNAT family N-acetyltransferase [Cellulosimicrobium funkei]TGA73717.1 GNAT family N-acetyltransferase [Cellulosimicrobium terreum]